MVGYINDGYMAVSRAMTPATQFTPHPTLTPAVFHILLALAGGERHGYAIMREAATRGHRMGPGTLYGTVKRLIEQGVIEEVTRLEDHNLDHERRRYYRITGAGLSLIRAEAARLAALVDYASARGLLDPSPRSAS